MPVVFFQPWRLRDDVLDRALLAGILAGQDEHLVALADVRHALVRGAGRVMRAIYSTSGASETIFM